MNKPVSNCCGAPVRVEGDVTMCYVCEKCGEACDVNRNPLDHVPSFAKCVLPLTILLASTIWCFAQRGAMPFNSAASGSISMLAVAPTPFKQTYLTWDNPPGASNRVSWGTVRNYWTNGSALIFTNRFPITNGTAYKVTALVDGVESIPALWPSNRLGGDLWLVGYGTNMTNPTNIVKLLSYQGNNPPGNMRFWGVVDLTTGWE